MSLPALRARLPVFDWLSELDDALAGDPGLLRGPFVLDLTEAVLHAPGLRALTQALRARNLAAVGMVGLDAIPSGIDPADLPPLLQAAPPPLPPVRVVDFAVRSGQRVETGGDLIILGGASSGAELSAGGSIHVYGALRGRAFAGRAAPCGDARIFCRTLDAELLAIGDATLAGDAIDPALRGRAVQCWRDRGELRLAPLD